MILLFVIVFFTVLGLIFGSFTNALVRRIHEGKKISDGRSECPKCKNQLGFLDLIPVFSWLFLKGKCRYCGEKIGVRYLLVELIFGFFFALTTYFLFPENIDFSQNIFLNLEFIKFLLILILTGNFLILAIYDILFLEIIDGIAIWIGFLVMGLSFTDFGFVNFQDGLIGAAIVYFFFYAQIFIPGTIFFLTEKKFKIKEKIKGIWTIIYSCIVFPIWMFFRLFLSEKTLEKCRIFSDPEDSPEIPAWIGGGDLRFALVMGFVLGWQKTILGLFLSYLVGGVYSISLLVIEKISGKAISHEVPFLPFLTIGTFIALMFGEIILEFYFKNFIYI